MTSLTRLQLDVHSSLPEGILEIASLHALDIRFSLEIKHLNGQLMGEAHSLTNLTSLMIGGKETLPVTEQKVALLEIGGKETFTLFGGKDGMVMIEEAQVMTEENKGMLLIGAEDSCVVNEAAEGSSVDEVDAKHEGKVLQGGEDMFMVIDEDQGSLVTEENEAMRVIGREDIFLLSRGDQLTFD
jgi:hypothetical protein